MADCKLLEKCLFFNDKMPGDSAVGELYKTKFCKGDCSNCARFVVAIKLGREKVPTNLYPNMLDRANQLIAQGA